MAEAAGLSSEGAEMSAAGSCSEEGGDGGSGSDTEQKTHAALQGYNIITEAEDPLGMLGNGAALDTDIDTAPIHYKYPTLKSTMQQKIVICLDISTDLNKPLLKSKDGTKYSYLEVVKSMLVKYMRLVSFNNEHKSQPDEYSLCIFGNKHATVAVKFVSKVSNILRWVTDLQPVKLVVANDIYNISHLFEPYSDVIDAVATSAAVGVDVADPPPEYLLRFVVIYARHNCIPEIRNIELQEKMAQAPYCFVDVLYLHGHLEQENDNIMHETIYAGLSQLDRNSRSYTDHCGPDITQLHNKMAPYIGHPLWRARRCKTPASPTT